MSDFGRKVGVFNVETVLARYALDVRLSITSSEFTILVPHTPGAKAKPNESSGYEVFRATSLDEVKRAVKDALTARDVTDYEDVIEYECTGVTDQVGYNRCDCDVGFDFKVARVSVVKNEYGDPKLEKSVNIGDDGTITEDRSFDGTPYQPSRHHRGFHRSMPFTIERWRKCCAIREGIKKLHELLEELFVGDDVSAKLDALRNPLLLGAASSRKFRGAGR